MLRTLLGETSKLHTQCGVYRLFYLLFYTDNSLNEHVNDDTRKSQHSYGPHAVKRCFVRNSLQFGQFTRCVDAMQFTRPTECCAS